MGHTVTEKRPLTAAQLQRQKISGHMRAAAENMSALSALGVAARFELFLLQVDPEKTLPEQERHRRAINARKAFFARIRLNQVKDLQDACKFGDTAEIEAEIAAYEAEKTRRFGKYV